MNLTDEQKRQKFEDWLNTGHRCGCNDVMWKAWQAALSLQAGEQEEIHTLRQKIEALEGGLVTANKTSRNLQAERNKAIKNLRGSYTAIEIASMTGLTRQRIHQILNEVDDTSPPLTTEKEAELRSYPFITEQHKIDLVRFHATCEDDNSYDVPIERVKSMAEAGLVRHITSNYYAVTDFGMYVLALLPEEGK